MHKLVPKNSPNEVSRTQNLLWEDPQTPLICVPWARGRRQGVSYFFEIEFGNFQLSVWYTYRKQQDIQNKGGSVLITCTAGKHHLFYSNAPFFLMLMLLVCVCVCGVVM